MKVSASLIEVSEYCVSFETQLRQPNKRLAKSSQIQPVIPFFIHLIITTSVYGFCVNVEVPHLMLPPCVSRNL